MLHTHKARGYSQRLTYAVNLSDDLDMYILPITSTKDSKRSIDRANSQTAPTYTYIPTYKKLCV